jgi:hypothetical protein
MQPLSRRDLLKLGALGAAGGAALPFLPARRARGDDSFTPWVLLVYASGGFDPTMVFDDKVGVGQCAQEDGWASATSETGMPFVDHPSRPSVKTFFDTYGANAAIVNGLSSGSMTRDEAVAQMFGGIPDKRFRRCDWLSFYAAYLNPAADAPHVVIDAPYMPGEYAPHAVKLTTARIAELQAAIPGADSIGDTGESALLDFRRAAFKPIAEGQNGGSLDSEKLLTLYYQFLRNDVTIARLAEIQAALGPPPEAGESDFVRNGKIAIELFAGGYSQCVTLQAGADDAWDTTTDHFARQSVLYEDLFSGLNSIMTYAEERGTLGQMIVIVMSERGRAPALNANAGKGPWPFTSVLLWGVGIAGNTVAGRTDALLRGLPINPAFGESGEGAITLEMANVMMGIYLKGSAPSSLFMPATIPLSVVLANE